MWKNKYDVGSYSETLLSKIKRRINLDSSLHFCFTLSFQSNDLTYLVKYSKRQEMIYKIISYLHNEERMSYRQITKKLNSFNIKTTRNKVFGESGNSLSLLNSETFQRTRREN